MIDVVASVAHRAGEQRDDPSTDAARLDVWERRSRPAIIAAALIPLIGVSTGTRDYGALGTTIEIACWVVFVVDLVVHMRLHPHYVRTAIGQFDLSIVVLTSPWYLLPGVEGGQFVTLLRLARLARVAMVGFQAPIVKRTLERLGKPALYVAMMLFLCAGIVQRAEHHKHGFKTYGDSLWWAVVTITTVGYGDLVPESRVGRLTATVLMLSGVALLGTVAASLASMFRLEDKADEDAVDAQPLEDRPAVGASTASGSTAVPPAAAPGDGIAVVTELRALRGEVLALREEVRRRSADG